MAKTTNAPARVRHYTPPGKSLSQEIAQRIPGPLHRTVENTAGGDPFRETTRKIIPNPRNKR